jgi:hypothetical protein
MPFDSTHTNAEEFGNLPIPLSFRQKAQYFVFAG